MSHSYRRVAVVKGGIDKKTMNKRVRKMSVLADIGNGDDYKEVEGFRRKSIHVVGEKYLRK